MEIVREKNKLRVGKVTDDEIEQAKKLIEAGGVKSLKFCSLIVAKSYKYTKNCEWLNFEGDQISITVGYAKKRAYGSGNHWQVYLNDASKIDEYKKAGWRLIDRELMWLSK